jgi:hypothetical protein
LKRGIPDILIVRKKRYQMLGGGKQMNRKKRYLFVIFMIFLICILAGCGSGGVPERAGKWETQSDLGDITLYVDKSGMSVNKIEDQLLCEPLNTNVEDGVFLSEDPEDDSNGIEIDDQGHFQFPFTIGMFQFSELHMGFFEGNFAPDNSRIDGHWILAINDGTKCEADWIATR